MFQFILSNIKNIIKGLRQYMNQQGLSTPALLLLTAAIIASSYILLKKEKTNQIEKQSMNFEFPSLLGNYGIGTTTRHLIDLSRQEPHKPSTKRELMIYIWYPTDTDKTSLARIYTENEIEAAKVSLRKKGYPEKDLEQLDYILTHAMPDVQPLKKDVPFPVILFSHGYLGTQPLDYRAFCEELASHGYVVVAIAHTYFASSVVFPDGHEIKAAPEKYTQQDQQGIKKDLELWIADAQFVIDQLSVINNTSKDRFFHCFDLNKIGMFGHSFGGLTSLYMLLKDSRIKAALDLDQMPYLSSETLIINKPFMFLLAQQTFECMQSINKSDEDVAKAFECDLAMVKEIRKAQQDWINMEENYEQLIAQEKVNHAIIPNIKHAGFSDYLLFKEMPLYKNNKKLMDLDMVAGTANGFEAMATIDKYIIDFFDTY